MNKTINTGNFHAFFPEGCYRKKLTARRKKLFALLDELIETSDFNMITFKELKQDYLNHIGTEKRNGTFEKLNSILIPLYLKMNTLGFSEKELQNTADEI